MCDWSSDVCSSDLEMKGWNLPEYIRITIGLPEENRAFITALKEELS